MEIEFMLKNKMKTLTLVALLAALNIGTAAPLTVEQDGHKLQIYFRQAIETNQDFSVIYLLDPDAIPYDGRYINFNYPLREKPFPRTNETKKAFIVTSNSYALFVLDGVTNTVATASTKIGEIIRTTKEVVVTQTNVSISETYTKK